MSEDLPEERRITARMPNSIIVWTRTATVGPEDRGECREVDLLEQRPGGQQGRDRDVDRDQEERPWDQADHQPHDEDPGTPVPEIGRRGAEDHGEDDAVDDHRRDRDHERPCPPERGSLEPGLEVALGEIPDEATVGTRRSPAAGARAPSAGDPESARAER